MAERSRKPEIGGIHGGERGLYYKRLIGLTYAKLCELEMAYLAGDEDKADDIKGELKDLKKDGHEKYTD